MIVIGNIAFNPIQVTTVEEATYEEILKGPDPRVTTLTLRRWCAVSFSDGRRELFNQSMDSMVGVMSAWHREYGFLGRKN